MGLDIYFFRQKRNCPVAEEARERSNDIYKLDLKDVLYNEDDRSEIDVVVNDTIKFIEENLKPEECNGNTPDDLREDYRTALGELSYEKGTIPSYDNLRKLYLYLGELSTYLSDFFNRKAEHTEVAYFRKVNFLVKFFNYSENCSDMDLSKDYLEELVDACDTVLSAKGTEREKEVCKAYLPSCSGFFFGDTEFNDYYFEDVREVRDTMTSIIESTDWDNQKVYLYCWW